MRHRRTSEKVNFFVRETKQGGHNGCVNPHGTVAQHGEAPPVNSKRRIQRTGFSPRKHIMKLYQVAICSMAQRIIRAHHAMSKAKGGLGKLDGDGEPARPIDCTFSMPYDFVVNIGLTDLSQKIVADEPLILPLHASSSFDKPSFRWYFLSDEFLHGVIVQFQEHRMNLSNDNVFVITGIGELRPVVVHRQIKGLALYLGVAKSEQRTIFLVKVFVSFRKRPVGIEAVQVEVWNAMIVSIVRLHRAGISKGGAVLCEIMIDELSKISVACAYRFSLTVR